MTSGSGLYDATTLEATAGPADTTFTSSSNDELNCRTFTFVVYVLLFGTMAVFGLVGNTLSFIVLQFDRHSHAATFLLQVMAVVDNLFLLTTGFSQMFTATTLYVGITNHWLTGYLQAFVWPLVHITQMMTVYMTVLIACNRYIAICHPYSAERLCSLTVVRIKVFVVLLFVCAYNVPRFFEHKIFCNSNWTSSSDGESSTTLNNSVEPLMSDVSDCRTELVKSEAYQIIYENVSYSVVLFFGPLVFLLFFNIALIWELLRSHRERRRSSGSVTLSCQNDDRHERNNITLVMLVIIFIFLATQTPAYINQLLHFFLAETHYECGNAYFYYFHVSNLIVSSNSSLNFVVYCVCRRNFRRRLADLCPRCVPAYQRDSLSSSLNRQPTGRPVNSSSEKPPAYIQLMRQNDIPYKV